MQLELCLPAAQELNLNPSLLTGFLEEKFGLPAASANILRTKFLTADRQLFCLKLRKKSVYQAKQKIFVRFFR